MPSPILLRQANIQATAQQLQRLTCTSRPPIHSRAGTLRQVALGLCLAAELLGCTAKVEPWERGVLAKRQMALIPDAQDAALREHTFISKEAAIGGYGVGGGGCGCN